MYRDEKLKRALQIFFEAMRCGWAAGAEGVDVPGMPGFKRIPPYEKDGFGVVDRFCVSSAGKSAGTTTIWRFSDPIWVMNYSGVYPKEVIPFLKQALMAAYEKNEFFGGRGPLHFEGEGPCSGLIYDNNLSSNSFSSAFDGFEAIFSSSGKHLLGIHRYHGIALI